MDIKSMNLEELNQLIVDMGEKPFRSKQIFEWLHSKQVESFEDMTNISKPLREKLAQKTVINNIAIAKKLQSKEDDTIKYLFILADDNIIESVLMRYDYGNTICISSQVGCRMGCSFCASAIDGFVRNLTAGEMLSQIYNIQKDVGQRISNIVIMGSGEPFDNFDNVMKFITIVNSPYGLNIGQRHITLSTSGMAERMCDFADLGLQVTLAVSLHAPNDGIRKTIMPIAKRYSIEELLSACKYYINTTNRRITFEYSLINDINDSDDDARELGKKLRHMLCHVNLIPINEIKEKSHRRSTQERVNSFAQILESFGIETTIRKRLGTDIDAACGQLRRSFLNNGSSTI